jgi:uncharacterized protein DUF4038/collagenase-like protein with putative collagen-binding domain
MNATGASDSCEPGGRSGIRVSPSGRGFCDAAGQPVFFLGDTLWELFRLFEPAEALEILQDRQAKGFSAALIMLFGVDMTRFGQDTPGPHVNLHGQGPWIDNDPLRPNEEYFRHIDAVMPLAERTGQTFIVGVYHQWQVEVITLEKARPWARWVANRYRDVPNLIWSMYPAATEEFVPISREVAAGLREGDGGSHLISVHPDPAVASSSFLHDEDWLAFNMIQTCIRFDEICDAVSADYARAPTKPVIMAEGGYEGTEFDRLQTRHDIRKQAYWSQLAGGYHIYGHNDAWAAPREWRRWIDSPGSRDLKVFREIITACEDWWEMLPDASLLAAGAGEGFARNLAARSPAGRWALAYLSEPSTITLRAGAITASRTAQAYWVDPTNTQRQDAGLFAANAAADFTTPEGWEDAVLLVEAEV